jgi:hypothetical protein
MTTTSVRNDDDSEHVDVKRLCGCRCSATPATWVVTTVVVVNDLAEVLEVLLLLLSEIGFLFPVCLFHRLPRLHALRDSFFRVVALHWLVTWHYEDLQLYGV